MLTNEKSEGCHLPDITLSECCATTTLGNGAVRSPCRSVKTSLRIEIVLKIFCNYEYIFSDEVSYTLNVLPVVITSSQKIIRIR